MIEDQAQKDKALKVLEKRNPGAYGACPKKKCPMFDIIDVAPGMVMAFMRFPLALLPTFVVPLIISSHVVFFIWYLQRGWSPHRS